MTEKIDLSIIIPNYKTAYLPNCLKALAGLNVQEIIVVDSSPRASEIDFLSLGVQYIHVPQRLYAGEARNIGARKAKGRWLLFIDADIEMTAGGLDFIRKFDFSNPGDVIFGPYIADRSKQNFSVYLQNLILVFRYFEKFDKATIATMHSSHFMIESSVFWQIGGFDQSLKFREDHNFCVLAHKLGYKIKTEQALAAYHHRRFNPASLVLDYFRRSFGTTQTRLLWPLLYGGENVPGSFMVTWLMGCLLPLLFIFSWLGYINPLSLFVATMLVLISPLFLSRSFFSRMSWVDQIKTLLLWPVLGCALLTGVISAYLIHFFEVATRKIISLIDGIKLTKRILVRNGWPVALVQFLNSKCNLRCSHCFYKETMDQPNTPEMSVERLGQISKEIGPLLWYSVGGGEPFLRKDFVQALAAVCRVSRPWILSIPTNGWYTDKIFIEMRRFIESHPYQRIMLTLSLDGPPSVHDSMRGPNSWIKAKNTYKRLELLQQVYPQLSLGIITVVDQRNAHVYPHFIDELVSEFNPQQIAVTIFRDLKNIGSHDSKVVAAHGEAVERYKWHCDRGLLKQTGFFAQRFLRAREAVKNRAVAMVAQKNSFVAPCLGGNLFYTIWEDGRLSPCEIRPEAYVNLMQDSWSRAIFSAKAKESRRDIVENKCKCTYECAMSVNALFSWPLAIKTLWQTLKT